MTEKKTENDRIHERDVRNALIAGDVPSKKIQERRAQHGAEENESEKRPGPSAQDRSRTPPSKEQREKDYQPEKRESGEALKKQGKDELGFPTCDESKFG